MDYIELYNHSAQPVDISGCTLSDEPDTNKFVEEFTASIDFDKRLYHQDIRGSIAHARMLGKQGIISLEDMEKIVDMQMKEVQDRLIEYNIQVQLTEAARKWLAKEGYDPAFGARPLRRAAMPASASRGTIFR